MSSDLGFDFDFSRKNRSELLASAIYTARGLYAELGEERGVSEETENAAIRLLKQLDQEVAEFTDHPDILPIQEEHFKIYGIPVPAQFQNLSEKFNFYWIRFPITLKPLDNTPFIKLKCAVEFNPSAQGHLRPKAHSILPDKKFKQYLAIKDSLELSLGENLDFEVAVGASDFQLGEQAAKAIAELKTGGKANLSLVFGPFDYSWRKAEIDHSPVGTEKVFWQVEGEQFFQGKVPSFVVILQVPKEISSVEIAAALQAYHRFGFWTAEVTEAIKYMGEQLKNFFRAGAPVECRIENTKAWNITQDINSHP